jgi:hypothetical protein
MVVSSRRRLSVEKCVIAERSLEARVRSNLKFEPHHDVVTTPGHRKQGIKDPRRLLSGRGQDNNDERRERERERERVEARDYSACCVRPHEQVDSLR